MRGADSSIRSGADEVSIARNFVLRACDCEFSVSADVECSLLIDKTFGALVARSASSVDNRLSYRAWRDRSTSGFRLLNSDDSEIVLQSADALVFQLDKQLILALQHRRRDLFFLHGAVVEIADRVAVISAPAGTGKSTFTLALLERGASYLSDELAPIDVARRRVHPFPHALCLKSAPPAPWQIPADTIRVGTRLYAPVKCGADERPVAAFFFLRRNAAGQLRTAAATCRRVTAATAAAHLMANALNSLAHDGNGLDSASALARNIPAFELDASDLSNACETVESVLLDL